MTLNPPMLTSEVTSLLYITSDSQFKQYHQWWCDFVLSSVVLQIRSSPFHDLCYRSSHFCSDCSRYVLGSGKNTFCAPTTLWTASLQVSCRITATQPGILLSFHQQQKIRLKRVLQSYRLVREILGYADTSSSTKCPWL